MRKSLMLSAHVHLASQMDSVLRVFTSLTRATRPAHPILHGVTKCSEENIYKLHWKGKFVVDRKIVAYMKMSL
jgi:hypothetical protein